MPFERDYLTTEPARQEIDAIPGPALLEFGTTWCEFCRAIQGPLESLLTEFPQVSHVKIEDGKGRLLGRSFHVKLWPNFVFLRDGRVVGQVARPTIDEVRRGLDEITRDG
ncbi:MAG: thioredoxin family protein [Gemmataceae bacterium]